MHFKRFAFYKMLTLMALYSSGCSKLTLTNLSEDDFSDPVYFSDVVTIAQNRCGTCHMQGTSEGAFNLDPADGVDPDGDEAIITALRDQQLVDESFPESSVMLSRPLEEGDGDTHPSIFENDSDADYKKIRKWIASGLPLNSDSSNPIGNKSFANDIKPLLTSSDTATGCTVSGCHVTGSATTSLVLQDSPDLHTTVQGLVNTADPAQSTLLLRATGNSHGGGTRWQADGAEAATVQAWITQGAQNN